MRVATVLLGAIVVVLAAAASLILLANTPVFAVPLAPIDDGLFARLGMSIRETGWLGEFDELTLSKGMAYPYLLAVADALSVPAKVAEQLGYLAGAAAMSWVAARLAGRPALGVVLFVILALDPVWMHDQLMRIRRETMYAGTGLLLLAGVAWLFLVRAQDPRGWRVRDFALALLVGVAAAVFWLVREEGVWLLPAAGLVVVVGVSYRLARTGQGRRVRSLAWPVAAGVVLGIGFTIVIGTVIAINDARYGVAVTNDFRDGAFPRAVAAFSRIDEDPPERYVHVSQADLQAAYETVPLLTELQPVMEPLVERTLGRNCGNARLSRFVQATGWEVNCGATGYAWFPWELRLAMGAAGLWEDGPGSQANLVRLADEIDAACEEGRLTCSAQTESLYPITLANIREAVELMPDAFEVLAESRGPIGRVQSRGTEEALRELARFTHGPIAETEPDPFTDRGSVFVRGFVASPSGTPVVTVDSSEAQDHETELRTFGDPSLLQVLAEADAAGLTEDAWQGGLRFRLTTDCLSEDCLLTIDHGNGIQSSVQMAVLGAGRMNLGDGVILAVGEVAEIADATQEPPIGTPRDETVLSVQQWLDDTYRAVLPWFSLLGLIGCISALVVPSVRRGSFLLGTFTVAAGVAVLSRFGLIGLLEVAAWPGAMAIAKLAPASPFLITFAVLGSYLLVVSVLAVGSGLRERRASLS